MPDMLVKLYDLPDAAPALEACAAQGVQIRRAMTPDKAAVTAWAAQNLGPGAGGEADVCFARFPVSCFLATRGRQIVGFACYNATAPDFFGPTAVAESERGSGVGKALLLRSLQALRDEGYAYAIIGGVGPAEFYAKCTGAVLIEGSSPGIYRDYLGGMND